MANFAIWRAVYSGNFNGGTDMWLLDVDVRTPIDPRRSVEWCWHYQVMCSRLGSPMDVEAKANIVGKGGLDARHLIASLQCGFIGTSTSCNIWPPSWFSIFRARIGLIDRIPPVIGQSLSGTLLDGSTLQGEGALTFRATDRGGGLAKVGLLVDNKVAVERMLDTGAGGCRQPYVRRVSCPLANETTLPLDTAAIADGAHVVQAFAIDVSGNRGVSAPFHVTTRNVSLPNGAGASRLARLTALPASPAGRRLRRALRYGQPAEVRGRLSAPGGQPIANARIDVLMSVDRPGAVQHSRSVLTDDRGRFVYRVPRGASRRFTVGYRAFSGDEDFAATSSFVIRVRAAVELAVSRRRVKNGQRVRFRGRLVGGPHRADASMILYALGGDRRIPVTSLRADTRGRFSYTYRFRTVQRRSTFRFQVRTESRPGYPYAAGSSKVARLVVHP